MAIAAVPLGNNLRRLRARAGLSVVELARRAGLGRATLTQLEAGSGNPTLETLYALANELGVALSELIAEAEPGPEPHLVRRGDGPRTDGAVVESHLLCRRRTPTLTIEVYAITLHGDALQRSAAHPPGTREHLHVHTGHVQAGPADAPLELDAGDYADYPADTTHIYRRLAQDKDPAATLMIVTPVAAASLM